MVEKNNIIKINKTLLKKIKYGWLFNLKILIKIIKIDKKIKFKEIKSKLKK